MNKTRVPKGERYWYIDTLCGNIDVSCKEDNHILCSDENNFKCGNYFHTKEEAEAMAKKIRAVLKGADVIEMPNEEEICNKVFDISRNPVDPNIGYVMCLKMAQWFITKIVK